MKLKKWMLIGGVVMLTAFTAAGCGTENKENNKNNKQGSSVSPAAVEEKGSRILKEAFAEDFTVGVAVNMGALNDSDRMSFVCSHFNSITMENEMKPDSLLDGAASEKSSDGMPEINTKKLDQILSRAKENNIPLRGHTLVWHNQTPDWFFSKDYEPSKGLAGKDEMRKRMEAYIKKVLTYCQENYPGVVYAWDVVNEAMADEGGCRTKSRWYDIYGDESYIEDAFTFARKYADPEVKLFYNDYNEYMPAKREMITATVKKLKEKGVLDGVGMQSHWDMDYPTTDLIDAALEKYGAIEGLEIQLTEIDMHNTDDSEEGLKAQADRYKQFFQTILRADRTGKANITNVTFWGITDEDSWLTNFKGETSYPLLFQGEMEKKPCYESILETAGESY
ncbi:MAG: endo-1,4-beta-xylanase [Eubacterium sp.]|nr:endo-1,4-beta-xylanase [Eubacterium sp.]